MTTTDIAIQALWSTNKNALLFKLNSLDVTCRLCSKITGHHFLKHICPSAFLQPHSFKVIMQFIPYNGSFDPSNTDHIHQIKDHNLPLHSITAASWIKKPELRAPNQKLVNVKVICASAEAANTLLTKCIFITNAWVTTSKDIIKPTRCNKCQHYRHIRDKCVNNKQCAHCAKEHTTTSQQTTVSLAAPPPLTQAQTTTNAPPLQNNNNNNNTLPRFL